MVDTLLARLFSMLDVRSVGVLAGTLGASEHGVLRGLKSSIAALLGGLACNAHDPGLVGEVLNLDPSGAAGITLSQLARSASDPNSFLIGGGEQLVLSLFGDSENVVTEAIAEASGLRIETAAAVLSIAAPLVIGFLNKRVRDQGMTLDDLGNRLENESGVIRKALPANLRESFLPMDTVISVAAQEVPHARSRNWLPVVAIVLGLAAFWFLLNFRRPSIPRVTPAPTGSASRVAVPKATGSSNRFSAPRAKGGCTIPTKMKLPEGGVESRLLASLQSSDAKSAPTTWLTFDRLAFDTGAATLRPESDAQLDNIAAILKLCPAIHLKIAGYTDNAGPTDTNLRLSRNMARSVMFELISRGVSPDRLTAGGYGREHPVADNTTVDGRAKNRRVAMLVTKK